MTARMPRRDLGFALLTVLIWGLNFLAMKFAVVELPPFLLGTLRFALAAFPLVLFLPRPALPWRTLLVFGLVQGVLQFGLLFEALAHGMPAGLASVVMQTQAFFTLVLGALWLKEPFQARQMTGLLVALAGMTCLGLSHGLAMPLLGFLLTVGSGLAWAVANLLARRLGQQGHRFPAIQFIAWSSLCAVPPFALLSWLQDGPAAWALVPGISLRAWLSVLFLAWASTLLAYSLWTTLLARHPANRIAPFSLLVPTLGLGTAAVVLGEQPTGLQWLGSVLVLAGLAVNMGLARRQRAADAGGIPVTDGGA